MFWIPALLLVTVTTGAQAQATAQSSVAPELRECYLNTTLLDRNNLPPTSMAVLIDIIRKLEDNPNINLDLRMLATQILHTYRQDGNEYHQRSTTTTESMNVLPYAPTFHSFHRHRLVLRTIPSNQQTLANTSLPSDLKCALHHMISTTVDARLRNDENTCGQLSQYRAMRTARSIDDDVEILDLANLDADINGQMQNSPDVEYMGRRFAQQLLGESTCPILTGVVNTRWGAVSGGNLLAGIAAGSERQQVSILELTKGSELNYQNVQQSINSIYPATLSGDLAEAVLIQGTRGSNSISVGNAGNWNSSQATRFYMLSGRTNIEMTDPEIRGGLDGFFLGTTLSNTLGTFSSLRLSQLLDMYYSPVNGVFNPTLRACNRRELSQQYIATTNLVSETRAFAAALDTVMLLEGTIIGGLDNLVNSAVTNFQSYTNNNLNDLNCDNTATTRVDTQLRTNLYIAIDGTWPYQTVYPAISYLLDAIEVGKFGSSITLLSASDGSVLINQTFSLADFHTKYTSALHQTFLGNVNLLSTYTTLNSMMKNMLTIESSSNYVGGNATVLLFLLNSGNIENNQNVFEQARILNDTAPDLRVLYATSSNQQDNLWNIVRDMRNDIMTVALPSTGFNVDVALRQVLTSIQTVGRRIINPVCGADFVDQSSGTRQFVDHITPGYINYYKLSPNYFYQNNENTKVRVSRSGATLGNLIVCHSRVLQQPRQSRQNTTAHGASEQEIAANCTTLPATGNVEIFLFNACDDSMPINACSPLYLSVEATETATLNPICTSMNNCRFPFDVAYLIQVEELRCFNSGTNITASHVFLFFGLIINILRFL
ncbi:hypothetical protein ACJJTC_008761 [Scirpophaga incertulas]